MVLAISNESVSVQSALAAAVLQSAERGGGGGVWREHSYARCAPTAAPAAPRRLLRARSPPAPAALSVDAEPPPPPALPLDAPDSADLADVAEEDEEEWDARLQPPSAAHARLARAALDVLQDLRLARLAAPLPPGGGRALHRDQERRAAARLRRVLAPAWSWGGAGWLLGALGRLPAAPRRLLRATLLQLARAAPRLAARLPPAVLAVDPLAPPPDAVASARGPLVLWVSAGGAADARWERRLRALLPTRVLAPPTSTGALSPERWCAAHVAHAKAALLEALADVGSEGAILAGAGSGAALCGALGAVSDVLLGAALLAPALLTAEGPRERGDEPTLPALLVVGTAAAAGRVAALEAAGPRGRLLLVEGADDALRLPHRLRLRLRVPQAALDAAVVEEVARWASELAEAARDRRHSDATDDAEPDEYAHLPQPAPGGRLEPHTPAPSTRAIEIIEGRVVSRCAGGTPLLLPPRRPDPPGPAPADIMQMPIVFADDEPAPSTVPEGSPVTVTSGGRRAGEGEAEGAEGRRREEGRWAGGGALKYTRVIVAKRGATVSAARPARPVLLRRALRVVGRGRPRPAAHDR